MHTHTATNAWNIPIGSLFQIANQTGLPMARGMVLEFPTDPMTWGNATQYQFMSGEWLLVAPVYSNASADTRMSLSAPTYAALFDLSLAPPPPPTHTNKHIDFYPFV